ncbi:hypothetical protein DFH29DRAFT_774814, partial [Suillus ampliporus]
DRRENAMWTERERVKAEAGEIVWDLDDLRSKVCSLELCNLDKMYIAGCRTEDSYVRIPMGILKGSGLDLCNSDGSLMAFVCPSLPEAIRRGLTSSLLACFDGKQRKSLAVLSSACTSLFGIDTQLWWHDNDIADQGDDAPTHIHPHDMARVDVSRTNHTQCLPYTSKDILEHQQLYSNILAAFGELFEWIEYYLPEEYEVLVELGQNLPGGECSPVAPFLSLVINLNVTTQAHRDRFDKILCLVLPIGTFTGGALVMFEQGLVLELSCGDCVIFHSADTTHFNLHYEG